MALAGPKEPEARRRQRYQVCGSSGFNFVCEVQVGALNCEDPGILARSSFPPVALDRGEIVPFKLTPE